MSCETLQLAGGGVLHISYGPAMEEVSRENLGERWCFSCRKRSDFFFIVTAPIEPSYYGPSVAVKCGQCGAMDGDCFPGREREWE